MSRYDFLVFSSVKSTELILLFIQYCKCPVLFLAEIGLDALNPHSAGANQKIPGLSVGLKIYERTLALQF